MMDLKTETEFLGNGACVVSVAGELDLYTAPRFEEELLGAVRYGTTSLIVDLTACGFFDSTALKVLVRVNKRLSGSTGRIALITGDPHVLKVFQITGLDAVFAFHPTRAEALSGGVLVSSW